MGAENGTSIKEMISQLVKLDALQWGGYAFYHEPLERKFTEEQKRDYILRANACGKETAERLREKYPESSVMEMTKAEKFRAELPKMPTGGGHVLFASYVEPDEMTVYLDCVEKAEALAERENLWELLPGLNLTDVLLAHELFHGIEYRNRKEIYTQTEKIELWRKPFSNRSRILCLSEMAAMAFAKELTGLPFSPYVLDVLLMYSYNEEAACALYEEILEAAGIRERKETC